MTANTLTGSVAVRPTAKPALPALIATLDPDHDDIIRIDQGVLHVKIDSCDVPSGFHATVSQALTDFCEKHASAAAVFDYDGATMVVGPSAQARKDAHVAWLASRINALSEQLTQVLAEKP